MNIELRGTSFSNKGAYLMLLSIVEAIKEYKNRPVLHPNIGEYHWRNSHQIATLGWSAPPNLQWLGPLLDFILNLSPKILLDQVNIVPIDNVHAVFDASGYLWGEFRKKETLDAMLQRFKFWKKQNRKIILLPQTFGPMENDEKRKIAAKALSLADKIFPRESKSKEFLESLPINSYPELKIFPDFTPLISGKNINEKVKNNLKNSVLVIPNNKMVTATDNTAKSKYPQVIVQLINKIESYSKQVMILTHEDNKDPKLIKEIIEKYSLNIPLIVKNDPLEIKSYIGHAHAVISSRYHGCVNALSRGVPCLGTSWSHKYEALFERYQCPENIIDIIEDNLEDKLELILDEKKRDELIPKLEESARQHVKEVNEMWKDVFDFLERN